MPIPRRKLHTDRPDFTAALRSAAWRYHLTGESFAPKDVLQLVQQARHDLGLAPLQGGASSDQLQRRTKGKALHDQSDHPCHYETEGTQLVPAAAIKSDWRFLETPSHAEVRLVAREGYLAAGSNALTFTTRGSHLPSLTVLYGALDDVRRQVELHHKTKRGLYFLRRDGQNYAGQTREFGTRGRSHQARGADFVIFAYPQEEQLVSSDILNVAESLVIVGLSELFKMDNPQKGYDAKPQTHELRPGAALALSFMAAVTRWAYQNPEAATEFLYWRTDLQGLREAYLSLTPYGNQP